MKEPSNQLIEEVLSNVMDPEIPVISVVDLGIIRKTDWDHKLETLHVEITPTYSGCPALAVIEEEVRSALVSAGIKNVKIHRTYSPAWTTDWLTDTAKVKLKAYGICPPKKVNDELFQIGSIGKTKSLGCPFCNSIQTELRSEFGSTACKSLYYCNECRQPFEYFKPI